MEYLDCRDLAKELEALQEQYNDDPQNFDKDDFERLENLKKLNNDINGGLEGTEEEGLIPEQEWKDYCKQFAEDCGYLSYSKNKNPLLDYVDWNRWAEDFKANYEELEFEGVTYFHRV